MSEVVVFVLALVFAALLVFLHVYFIIILSDLESDYINVQECCSLLNKHWYLFLLNVPVLIWNCLEHFKVPAGNLGVFDPTEIHNSSKLHSHLYRVFYLIGFYFLLFFTYVYYVITNLLEPDPWTKDSLPHHG